MTYGSANHWRRFVSERLSEETDGKIVGISPLRCEPIVGDTYKAGYNDPRFGTARAIGSKNLFDTVNCDMVLAYLPKPDPVPVGWHQSYGTIAEVAWGRGLDKPVLLVSNDAEIINHPVINFCANWLLDDLEQAIETIVGILGGYVGGKNV